MKVTGFQIMDRIVALREQSQTLNSQFTTSLYHFEKEVAEKPDPRVLMTTYLDNERKVALLQEAQAAYNLKVIVEVLDEKMSLQNAVKLIGSVTRVKNNWLAASKPNTDANSYASYYQMVRDKENEYAQRAVGVEECLRLSNEAADLMAALKQAIRSGNAAEIELEIDPSLFR